MTLIEKLEGILKMAKHLEYDETQVRDLLEVVLS